MATQREKIVLVETDAASRQALEAELKSAGYEVFSAESCSEGFEVASQAGADLVVLDAGAPGSCWSAAVVELKGAAATEAIRVLVISSLGPEERARALDLGADDVIRRPVETPVFLARVRNQLRTKRAADGLRDRMRIAEEGQQIAHTAFEALAVTEKMTRDAFSLDRRLKVGLALVLGGVCVMALIFFLFTRRAEKENKRAYTVISQLEHGLASQETLLARATKLREENKSAPEDADAKKEELKQQTELLRAQIESAEGAEVSDLRKQLAETTARLKHVEDEGRVAEGVIRTYSRSVCLLHVSVAFRDKGSGGRLRYAGINPKGEPLQDSEGKPIYSLEGRGPEVRADFFGTSFLVGKDGRMLTNRHVVEPWWKNDELAAIAKEGIEPLIADIDGYCPDAPRPLRVSIQKISEETDLAVVAAVLDDPRRPVIGLDERPAAAVSGNPVVLMGYPTGLDALLARVDEETMHSIVQSSGGNPADIMIALVNRKLIRPITTQGHIGDVEAERIVYDAQTTSGGSGGPLFNLEGKVIGVNYAILRGFGGSNFGIPIRYAGPLLKR
jgi:DNA-binding response OmpR family regulator/S1-C subfamily serine protease